MVSQVIKEQSAYSARFDEVAKGLRDAGMTVEDEIAPLGHFRGVADEDKIEHLKKIPGVAVVDVTGDEGEEEKDDYSIS